MHRSDRDRNPKIYSLVSLSTMGVKTGAPESKCETENRRGEGGIVGSSHEIENGRASEMRDIEEEDSGKPSTCIRFFTVHRR
jgi:hypothetical protein